MVAGMNAGHAAPAEWECGFFGEEAPNHVVDIGAWNGVRDFKTAYLQSLLFPEVMNANSAGMRGRFALARYRCRLGFVLAGMMGMELARTTTIAEGGQCCDFRYRRKRQ